MTSLPAAVLFDMDGTLIDSEPYWIAAEHALLELHGGTWTEEQAHELVGSTLIGAAEIIRDAGVPWEPERIVEWLLDRVVADATVHVPWTPGARALLALLREADIPAALVTMSYRRFAQVVADQAGGEIQVVIAGDEVTNGKPHPEAFLLAAERLGVSIEDCVAIEDSRPGVAAALASGAHTLGVEGTVPLPVLPGLSRTTSLELIDLAMLGRLVDGEVLHLGYDPTVG